MSISRQLLMIYRLLIEAVFLYVVWHHSHWSVALVLTLLTANEELHSFANDIRDKRNRRKQTGDKS